MYGWFANTNCYPGFGRAPEVGKMSNSANYKAMLFVFIQRVMLNRIWIWMVEFAMAWYVRIGTVLIMTNLNIRIQIQIFHITRWIKKIAQLWLRIKFPQHLFCLIINVDLVVFFKSSTVSSAPAAAIHIWHAPYPQYPRYIFHDIGKYDTNKEQNKQEQHSSYVFRWIIFLLNIL